MSRKEYFAACKSGDIDTVIRLENVVRGNDVDKESDMTGLMLASMQGCVPIVDYLVKLTGIDVNVSNKYGYTALMLASRHNHLDVVDRLLKTEGINVEAKNKAGKSAEDLARGKSRWDVLNMLQEATREKSGGDVYKRKLEAVQDGIDQEVSKRFKELESNEEKKIIEFSDAVQMAEVQEKLHMLKKEKEAISFTGKRRRKVSDNLNGSNGKNGITVHNLDNTNSVVYNVVEMASDQVVEQYQGQVGGQQFQMQQGQVKMEYPRHGDEGEAILPHPVSELASYEANGQENDQNQEVMIQFISSQNGQVHQVISPQNNHSSPQLNGQHQQIISPHQTHNLQITPNEIISPHNNHNQQILSPTVTPQYSSYVSPHHSSSQQVSPNHAYPQQVSPQYVSPQSQQVSAQYVSPQAQQISPQPQQVSPHYISAQQVSPHYVSPQQVSPHNISRHQTSPQQVFPQVASPQSFPQQVPSQPEYPANQQDSILAQVMTRLETDLNDLHSLGKGFSADLALARTAIGLGMAEFYDTCVNSLVNNMAVDNVLEVVKLAEESDDAGLRERVVAFVRENIRGVAALKEWKQVMRKYPDFLLEVMDGLLGQ